LAITCPVGSGRAYAEPRRGASSSRIKYALAPIAEPPRAVEAYLEGTPLASPSPYLACHAILTGDDPNRPTRPVGDPEEWRVSVGELFGKDRRDREILSFARAFAGEVVVERAFQTPETSDRLVFSQSAVCDFENSRQGWQAFLF
jgi:hypothetical protein